MAERSAHFKLERLFRVQANRADPISIWMRPWHRPRKFNPSVDGAALVELTKTENKLSARSLWTNTKMKNKFSSSVLYQGNIYGFDEAILACMDARTGELKWKGGRYGYGQLLLADGHLVVLSESGDVVLVKATPESHQELAKFEAISGKTWNVPAIDNGILLVRNPTEMASFRIGK